MYTPVRLYFYVSYPWMTFIITTKGQLFHISRHASKLYAEDWLDTWNVCDM